MTVTGTRPVRPHHRAARRRRGVGAGLGALATLVALVAGVPAALVATTGWPWPSSVPTAEQIGQQLLRPDDGHVLATVLIAVAWLAWLVFATGIVLEVTAQVRGTLPRRVPLIGSAQHLVAPLVAAAALLLHAPAGSTVALATAPTAATAVAPSPDDGGVPQQKAPPTASGRTATRSPSAETALRLYVVRPLHHGKRDTLWSIAAEHLGDPLRWHEIAQLNRGRPQPDGGQLTDPHWIRPGWRLLMPADAKDLPLANPPAPRTPPTESPLPVPPPTAPANPGAAERRLASPPLSEHRQDHATSSQVSAAQDHDDTEPALPIGLAAFGVLAAGLLGLLRRRRSVQRRHRRTGERIKMPPPEAATTEIRLRAAADSPRVDAVTDALHTLASIDAQQARHVVGAEFTEHGLELLLDQAQEAPAPFTIGNSPDRWRLTSIADLSAVDDVALPALASLGHRDGRLVFVDLERVGWLSLTGDVAAADRLLSWIAADLGVGAWATTANVTLIGVAPPLAVLDSERITSIERLTEEVVAQLESHANAFDTTGYTDALETRTGDPLEPWPVEVVLVGSAAASRDAGLLDRLLRCSRGDQRTGLAVVVSSPTEARGTPAVIEGDRLRIPQLKIDAQVAQLFDHQVADLHTLFQAASDVESEPVQPSAPPVPYPAGPHAPEESVATDGAATREDDLDAQVEAYLAADPTAVRIQLLGPVTVAAPGPLEPKRLPTTTELVAFLACSPHGATLADVDEAIWPERIVPRSTRNTVITRARAWVGTTNTDEPRLSRVDSTGRLHLADVLIDWQLFEQLVNRAKQRHGPERIDDLRRALLLVQGRPFESTQPGRYAWLAGRHLEEHMTAAVVDAAHSLAEELLAGGDAAAALDVARTAQLVDRHDERPWRDLLRAEAALGRTREVREHVRSLLQVLDVEVADDLMPETAQLIQELLASESRAAAG